MEYGVTPRFCPVLAMVIVAPLGFVTILIAALAVVTLMERNMIRIPNTPNDP
jgi:hypothetical protein